VDVVDEDILRQAANAGCRQIYYGIESVNHQVLGRIKKDIELEQVSRAIKSSHKCGIKAMGFFMVGNSGDTKDSVRETIAFAKDLGLDFIQVCRAIAKPGTELDKIMIDKTGKDYWRQHIKGDKIKGRLPTPWASLSESQIEALTKEFYLKFYFRPNMLWRRITQLKSLSEFQRYACVGWKMLLQKSELYSHVITDTSEAQIVLEESDSCLEAARKAKVAIIIPTYNEKDNISGIIKAIMDILPRAYIVVIDDNSPDGTAEIAQGLSGENSRIHLVRRPKKSGLGQAYKEGFTYVLKNIDAEYIFEMDADFSHNPRYLPIFIYYAQKFDLVTGSRFLGRVSIKNRSIWRNLISLATKWLANFIIGLRLSDVTTGFKCFRRAMLEKIDFSRIQSQGYAFQIEVSYHVSRAGGAIKEVPIIFYERTSGTSKMSNRILIEGIFLVIRLLVKRFVRAKRNKV
jgi:dolichol-phosphate mannosyltransferase